MNSRRKILIASAVGAVALRCALSPSSAFAQQPAKSYRIGVLGAGDPATYRAHIEALRDGLRNAGYIEGKNLTLEFRWAEGKSERLAELAGELVRLKPDVLITHTTIGATAARNATASAPIIAVMGDFVAVGLAASLARPGGNVTGISILANEVAAKRLELLLETAPQVKKVTVLYNHASASASASYRAMQAVAEARKITLRSYDVKTIAALDSALAAMKKDQTGAVIALDEPLLNTHKKTIAEAAVQLRLPLSGPSGFAEAGALTSSGVNLVELWRRMAYFADRILKGASPATFPIEQPTTFEFTVNLQTAKALGIKLPGSISIRATKVIE